MGALVNSIGKGLMSIALTGVTATSNGGIGAVINQEGVDVLITRCFLHVGTASTGAANLSCGIGATATTSSTDIISGLAVNGVSGNYYNGQAQQVTAKTQVSAPATWSAGKYIVFTGSADTTGLVGTLFVEYLRTA